mmetsp:Transcript_33624/g.56301  ORF Transcript_33624/g.56301 Transcript_33624/m.56301 type:complete len:288 (+) Transcript_33624:2-865(+)
MGVGPIRPPQPPQQVADEGPAPSRNLRAVQRRPKYVVFSNSKRSLPAAVVMTGRDGEKEPQKRVSKIQLLRDKVMDLEAKLQEADALAEQRLEEARLTALQEQISINLEHLQAMEAEKRAHINTDEEGDARMYRMHYSHLKYLWSRMAKERRLMTTREFRKRDYLEKLEEQRRELLTMKFATAVMLHWKDETNKHKIKDLHRAYSAVPNRDFSDRESAPSVVSSHQSVANLADVIQSMMMTRNASFNKEQAEALDPEGPEALLGFDSILPMAEKIISTSYDPAYDDF